MELMCFSVTWLHFFIRLLLHLVIKRVFGSEHIKTLSETVGFITVILNTFLNVMVVFVLFVQCAKVRFPQK